MSSPRLIQVIQQDHHAILALHEPRRLAELAWRLCLHAGAEEIVLHPLFIENLEHGKKIALQDKEEHETLRRQLLELAPGGAYGPESPEHTSRLAAVITSVAAHFKEEERNDLPSLEDAISEAVSTHAANWFSNLLKTPSPYTSLDDLLSAPTDKLKAELSKSLSGSERTLRTAVETKN